MTNVEKINKVLPNSARYVSENMANKILESEYQQEAVNFLIETETTCEIVFRGLAMANWQTQDVNSYRVTLKNKKHSYTFEFFDSIKNTEENKKATYDFYSVLVCLGYYISDDFDDFCSDFGYEFKNETEYIKAKSIHRACLDQDKNIKKLFTSDQINKLSEIN